MNTKEFDSHPSSLEVHAAAAAFLRKVNSYQGCDISRESLMYCALAEVWRQGRIYERDHDTAALIELSRWGVSV